MSRNHVSLILICAATLVPAAFNPVGAQDGPAQAVAPADSTLVAARRLANTARLAASEYRLGVVGGKVVLEPEVEEAALFLGEARRVALGLPAPLGPDLAGELEVLAGLVGRVGHPDSLGAGVERVVARLAGALGADMDELPSELPSLARGAEIYRAECASCHGNLGRGDGPGAVGLDPVPTKLADAEQLRDASPLDFYRRVTIGVAGTAMPSFEARYSVDDRWAVALYASVLRLPPARGDAPVRLADFPLTARLSDAAIAESLGTDGALDRIAAVRTHAGVTVARDYRQIFATVRARIDSALALAAQGQSDAARSRALDAYLAFEAVERELRVKDPALVASLDDNARVKRGGTR